MPVSSWLLLSALAYLVWTLICLEANARKARSLQVPVVRIPFSTGSNIWVLIQPLVWTILGWCVPIRWSSYPDFVRFSHRNWQFLEKSSPTERFGPVWALVSPAGIGLYVTDPDTAEEIFSRWKDFVRPVHKYGMLAFYGPSVFTVGLDDWPRHRKAVAAPFSEGLMKLVWKEALCQAEGMLHDWTTRHQGKIPSLEGDLRALTFNVLAATAFQEPHGMEGGTTRSKVGTEATEAYRDTLHIVLENSILLMLVPYRHLTGTLVPESLAKIGRAAASFKSILTQIALEETAAIDYDDAAPGGLLTPLVRSLSSRAKAPRRTEDVASKAKRRGLSADEILGNIFAINFAGHDTVLITLTFALTLLAAHPDVQEWLYEEIATVLGGRGLGGGALDYDEWDYNVFPQLNRCHAVFLETLRLFAPITAVPKMAAISGATSLQAGDQAVLIPPGVEVYPALLGIQTDARYWGAEPHEWRPSRWILRPGTVAEEELLVPRKGTFFPWSDGPLNCVGKKFSTVEGVAVLARLFHGHRLRLEQASGETEVQARKRARECAEYVNYNLLLRMNHPERVRLVCVKGG
ncbi:putative cytochrome P450 [Durotheca rogersii]|uniref:putative cytochrome P450 n=1 Tax=Durotheca rogersii TaxID=419775 RepID=UPI00221F2D9B|nr:putative cytochrome P450 [Durotheca rogersii]KAI5866716.1 putative cytochrome P450 [Durotheca rogersii]